MVERALSRAIIAINVPLSPRSALAVCQNLLPKQRRRREMGQRRRRPQFYEVAAAVCVLTLLLTGHLSRRRRC